MIKIMIVDDEQIVRDGIKFIIDHNFEDEFKIVGLAKSGREAIEMFEEYHPQIILMDIQMPGINGIEAIRAIKAIDPHSRVIIISAYEQFEYAKSAVELGAFEYILKPINKAKLVDTLNKVSLEIKNEKEQKLKEIETQEKLDKILPVLEYGYIYSVIMNTDYQKERDDYHNLLGINKEFGYMMVIELGDGDSYQEVSNKIGTGIQGNRQYKAIRNTIKFKCKAVVGPLIVNRISIMVYNEMDKDEYNHRVEAIAMAEAIHRRVSEIVDTKVFVGIGSCYSLDRMNISFSEAVKAVGKISDEEVLHIKDAVAEVDRKGLFLKLKNDQEDILKRVEEGNFTLTGEKMKVFFTKLQKIYSEDQDVVMNIVTELMVMIYTTGYRNDSIDMYRASVNYIDDIRNIKDFYELENHCSHIGVSIAKSIKGEKENKVSTVISEAMIYIDKHYAKDIGLKDVAEAVAISPQYFSKIFKKELGVNFIDYITNVRMKRAKEMLKEQTFSIKEICYEIGYKDPNYFSRLFKKVEGISPTEYH